MKHQFTLVHVSDSVASLCMVAEVLAQSKTFLSLPLLQVTGNFLVLRWRVALPPEDALVSIHRYMLSPIILVAKDEIFTGGSETPFLLIKWASYKMLLEVNNASSKLKRNPRNHRNPLTEPFHTKKKNILAWSQLPGVQQHLRFIFYLSWELM